MVTYTQTGIGRHALRQIAEYPKLFCFALSCTLAYLLYHYGAFDFLGSQLNQHGYLSMFFGGLLFSFGFTTPFGIAIFIAMADKVQLLPAILIGASGSCIADLFLFTFVRFSFDHELHKLKSTRWYQHLHRIVHHESVPHRLRTYLLWSIAGFIFASPLPDEVGVSLLSGITDVEGKTFAVFCFVFNALGILLFLLAARSIA